MPPTSIISFTVLTGGKQTINCHLGHFQVFAVPCLCILFSLNFSPLCDKFAKLRKPWKYFSQIRLALLFVAHMGSRHFLSFCEKKIAKV